MVMTPKRNWLAVLLLTLSVLTTMPFVRAQSLPVKTIVLPNGHHIYVVEKRDQPIVTIDTWVKTGSVNETADNNGVSHFLEHLIFKGTPTRKPGEVDQIIESKGAVFNAATSNDFTHYYITLPSSFFSQAVALHADMLLNAIVPPDELTRERPVVQEEINRSADNPQRQLFRAFMQQVFPGHGYGLDTLGPKRLIGTIPREKILGYYHYWYQPSRFHTVVVGDVSTDQAVGVVKQAFAGKDPRALKAVSLQAAPKAVYQPPQPRAIQPVSQSAAHVSGLQTINSLYWTIGWQAPKAALLDDVVALDAAMFALGGGRNSRLYKQLVEEQPLVTSLAAYNMTLKDAGTVQVYAEMKPENWPQVSQMVQQALHTLRNDNITQAELDAFKVQTLTEKRFNQESTDGLANNIGYFATVSKLADLDTYMEKVQGLTLEAVKKAVQKYIELDKTTSMAIVPSDQVKATLAAHTPWVKGLAQPIKVAHTHAAPASTAQLQSLTLPNGTRLVLNALPGAQTTTIKLFAAGGRRVESKPGLAAIAATMLTKGTHNRTAQDINELLEAKGLTLTVTSRDDVLEISGSATADEWSTLQTLLLDVLQHPNLTQAELDKARTRARQAILSSRDDLSTRASETFYQALYPNHPYGAVGQRVLDTLDSVTLEDVKAYLGQVITPSGLTVVLSGKLPVQPVKTVRQLVQQLPYQPHQAMAEASGVSQPPIVTEPPVLPAQPGLHEVTLPTASATRMIQGYQLPGIASPQYPVAKVLAAVLGNGMSSRLFTELREKQSLAYEIYASVQPGVQASTLMLVAGTDPKNQQAVEAGFKQQLDKLASTPLTPAELQAVKDKLVGQFALAHETPAEQAYYLGYYEAIGLGYGYDKTYPQQLKAVTAQQVQAFASQLLQQTPTWAVVRPAEKTAVQTVGPSDKPLK
jgi:zinc protease